MYPTCGAQQQKEIKTIRKRTLELELSDADVNRISKKAGAHRLTVAELLQNFIGDLVGGTYSNGSDEGMYAKEWFDRCSFGFFPNDTFLQYLVNWDCIDSMLELLDDIKDAKAEMTHLEEHPDEAELDELAELQEDIDYWQGRVNYYWNNYIRQVKECKQGTFDEEMKNVLEWRDEYNKLLNSK